MVCDGQALQPVIAINTEEDSLARYTSPRYEAIWVLEPVSVGNVQEIVLNFLRPRAKYSGNVSPPRSTGTSALEYISIIHGWPGRGPDLMSGHLFDRRIPLVKFTGALECAEGVGHPRTNTCPLCGRHARNMMRKSEVGNQNLKFGHSHGDLAMTFTCTARSALAVFLSFSLLSLTCEAQPLAAPRSQSSTKQFREDLPAVPQYPTSQPAERLGGQTPAAQAAGKASLNFPPDRNDSVALQCEQLAGQPLDTLRIGDGVDFDKDTGRSGAAGLRAGCRAPARTGALSISVWPRAGCGEALSRGSRAIRGGGPSRLWLRFVFPGGVL